MADDPDYDSFTDPSNPPSAMLAKDDDDLGESGWLRYPEWCPKQSRMA